MAIDSQRAPRARSVPADDAWLGPVLVAHGVLTPRQAERLRAQDGHSLWAAAVGDGATDEGIVAGGACWSPTTTLRCAGSSAACCSGNGFEVIEAGAGLDALELVEQGGVDLVILDVDMPRLDGLGVLEELRAQVRATCLPVIVLTARHGETEEKALDLGAHDYLSKPVQTRSLLARVRAVLKRASS
jgi:CheY-like chemotaxis protein